LIGVSNFAIANWNRTPPAKFSPRLQKFLTPGEHYTYKKDHPIQLHSPYKNIIPNIFYSPVIIHHLKN
jgi:hypothetical protein